MQPFIGAERVRDNGSRRSGSGASASEQTFALSASAHTESPPDRRVTHRRSRLVAR
jgi:hypothetical protein